MALELQRRGMEVEIAAMVRPGDEAEVRAARSALIGIPLHLFAANPPSALGLSATLDAFVRTNAYRFAVLHIHGIWEGSLARAASAFHAAGRPYVVSAHGMLDAWSWRRSRIKKALAWRFLGAGRLLNKAEAIVYGTEDEAAEAAVLGLRAKIAIIPNGVDPQAFRQDTVETRSALVENHPQIQTWDRTVLFFSRIHPKKGLHLLVEAFALAAEDFPKAGLLAVGIAEDKGYEAGLRERIIELGLQNRIVLTAEFTGAEARPALNFADIFALPSFQEGFSMAIIEALGVGLPVLITDRCHLNLVTGWGVGEVTPATTPGVEQGLRRLLGASDEALAAMGQRGIATIAEHFTWPHVGLALQQLYQSVDTTDRAST